ncbi:MAG: filamentous hemagglutinin N-terminal domain-containing protein [Burkholderiales bacterium]|nr:filamentous hemagglutinin N-terminal domain-containing protein [Burkholderiales bacterium]
MNASGKFSRKLLCLAVACVGAGAAHAGPLGAVVSAGRASYDPVSLTVTSTTAHTQIGWQSFNLGAGELVNFVQPNARSSVLNQIFNPQSLNLLGGLRSNGSVFFMRSGLVTGSGVNLDLAGMISTSLRLPQMALTQSGTAPPPRPAITLEDGNIYVISQDAQAVTTMNGDVFLNPGKAVELANASMPTLRVVLTAPDAESINLSRLVGGKRETGIFAGLFRIPAAARQAAQPEEGTILTASAGLTASAAEPKLDTPAFDRFYRYALLYAQMRRETRQGGMMRVAAAPTERITLPAVKSRPSVLPRDIEIGAPARAASEPLKEQNPQYEQKDQKAEPLNQLAMARELRPAPVMTREAAGNPLSLLALVSAEPPAEMSAERSPQPLALAFASAEPPAEMAAARSPQSTTLAFAPAEPPAEMSAARSPQPLALAFASAEPPAERAATRSPQSATLAFAPAEPPAEAVAAPASRAILVANGGDAEAASPGVHGSPQSSPAVIVVALAQHTVASAPHEDAPAREVLIERRAPRYFTDFRGAMFFM